MTPAQGFVKLSIQTNSDSSGVIEALIKIVYTAPVPPKEKTPRTNAGFQLPQPNQVYKDQWGIALGINDENDTAYLINSGNALDLNVNMDCKFLQSKIASDPDKKKLYEHMWIMCCLFFWGPLCDREDKDLIKDIFNKSFVSIFPFIDAVGTMLDTATD